MLPVRFLFSLKRLEDVFAVFVETVVRSRVGFCLLSAASLKLRVLDWLCVVLLGEGARVSVSMWCLVVVLPFLGVLSFSVRAA